MEDNAIRALIIGVMLFVLILTVTAVMIYYKTAVSKAQDLNNRTNYGTVYEKTLEEIDETTVTGIEATNIIRKYSNQYKQIMIKIYDTDKTTKLFEFTINEDSKDAAGNVKDSKIREINSANSYIIDIAIETDVAINTDEMVVALTVALTKI